MTLTVGIDEVGYGPSLGPLVVAAAAAAGPLPSGVRIGDSKKVFSQARGVGTLEPAVLGFVPAETYADLLARLSARLPASPWYGSPLRLPATAPLGGLAGSWARLVEADEFNACTRDCNKSDFLFEVATDLINRVRRTHPGPIRFRWRRFSPWMTLSFAVGFEEHLYSAPSEDDSFAMHSSPSSISDSGNSNPLSHCSRTMPTIWFVRLRDGRSIG